MTDALVSVLDIKSESIIINIEEVEREDWSVGGVLQYDKNNSKNEGKQDKDKDKDRDRDRDR